VSVATPLAVFSPGAIIGLPGIMPASRINERGTFIVCFTSGLANTTPGYYIGQPITVTTNIVNNVRITSWEVLSLDPAGDDCFLVSVTPILNTANNNVPRSVVFNTTIDDFTIRGTFVVPGGLEADNYYVGCLMYNEDLNQYRRIISYNAASRLAGLDLSPTAGGPINVTWSINDNYSIRKVQPQSSGTLPGGAVPLPFNSTNSFFLPPSTIVSVGDFIRFTSGQHDNTVCRVTAYTGNGLINPPANIVTIDCILDPIPVVSNTFEILQFTRDNAVPFCYSGSVVSQQEMVCYEIRLVALILPNSKLVSGGRIAFYPFVYVELQNVSASSAGTKCVIDSNNPHSGKMLFKAVVDDIRDPFTTPFVKLDGNGAVQTVKFKPNDNLKFGVYLPDGRPMETIMKDTFSPAPVNPLVQVSVIFELTRL
jgi:hypothetical protein